MISLSFSLSLSVNAQIFVYVCMCVCVCVCAFVHLCVRARACVCVWNTFKLFYLALICHTIFRQCSSVWHWATWPNFPLEWIKYRVILPPFVAVWWLCPCSRGLSENHSTIRSLATLFFFLRKNNNNKTKQQQQTKKVRGFRPPTKCSSLCFLVSFSV